MKIFYDPAFFDRLKKVDVRIKRKVREQIRIFSKNPNNPQLRNHSLKKEHKGYRSIDITEDYRALYKEVDKGNEKIAYFILLGTHSELYK